jgi:hypothetical protein
MREADDLEKAVWDRLVRGWLVDNDRRDALAQVQRALGLREAAQGPEHSDLIWPLSLKIELLHIHHHSPEVALEAAQVGERRLALQRLALRDAPAELLASLRELGGLYVFEFQVLDPARVKALEAEIERLEPS